jgi:hypothetical protein
LLGYGLPELLARLPRDSAVLALECDETIMAFSAPLIPPEVLADPRFRYARTTSPAALLRYVAAMPGAPFRRCVRVDLSGAAALRADEYARLTAALDDYIATYWKNRVTLMRLGRNYARNAFRNLEFVPTSEPAQPIPRNLVPMVIGAGPSLDDVLPQIIQERQKLYLIAVDTALPSLRDAGITPDAAVVVESQYWIEPAFVGGARGGIPLYADVTANPRVIRALGNTVRFFLSEYADATWLASLRAAIGSIPTVDPMGSVGLVALELADRLASPESTIFFVGLDFSWRQGYTHSRGAPAARAARFSTDRLHPIEPLAALATGVKPIRGGHTDPALERYAAQCEARFASRRNANGEFRFVNLGISSLLPSFAPAAETLFRTALCAAVALQAVDNLHVIATEQTTEAQGRERIGLPTNEKETVGGDSAKQSAREFLERERDALAEIKRILTGEQTGAEAAARLRELATERDYLYLHFPDGERGYREDVAFLKRMRIETEYFLKTIEVTLAALTGD